MSSATEAPGEPPIRVAQVLTRLNVGGLAVLVALLADEMRPPEFATEVFSGRVSEAEREGDMAWYLQDRGVTPRYVEALRRPLAPLRDLRALGELYRLFRRERFDVVHTHQVKAGLLATVAAWLAGVPVRVRTFHVHSARGYFGRLSGLYCAVERLVQRITTQQITLNADLRDELAALRFADPARIRLLDYGLDLSAFRAAPRHHGAFRRELGVPESAPLVGFCGRLQQVKRPDLFVAMAAEVHRAVPAARFVMIGDGELRPAVEAQIAAAGLEGIVQLAGWRQSPAPCFADLDLLVNLSLIEGTPLVIIEAGAAGVPAVASRVGGCAECVRDGETGWLVAYEDLPATVAAVTAALRDRDVTEAVGEAAREYLIARFGDPARMAREHAALYRELLGR